MLLSAHPDVKRLGEDHSQADKRVVVVRAHSSAIMATER